MAKEKLTKESLDLAKAISNKIWKGYDDTEKITRNNNVSTDIPDNIWFFWGQFDANNHVEFFIQTILNKEKPGGKQLEKWVIKTLVQERLQINRLTEKHKQFVEKL